MSQSGIQSKIIVHGILILLTFFAYFLVIFAFRHLPMFDRIVIGILGFIVLVAVVVGIAISMMKGGKQGGNYIMKDKWFGNRDDYHV